MEYFKFAFRITFFVDIFCVFDRKLGKWKFYANCVTLPTELKIQGKAIIQKRIREKRTKCFENKTRTKTKQKNENTNRMSIFFEHIKYSINK